MEAVVDDAVEAASRRDWRALRLTLHPYLQWTTADGNVLRSRKNVLELLRGSDPPKPPVAYELRDDQIYRWSAAP